LKQKLKKYK